MTVYSLVMTLRRPSQNKEILNPQPVTEIGGSRSDLPQCVDILDQLDEFGLIEIDELLEDIDFATRVLGPDTSVPDDIWDKLCETYPDHFQHLYSPEGKPLPPIPAREVRDRLLAIKKQSKE